MACGVEHFFDIGDPFLQQLDLFAELALRGRLPQERVRPWRAPTGDPGTV